MKTYKSLDKTIHALPINIETVGNYPNITIASNGSAQTYQNGDHIAFVEGQIVGIRAEEMKDKYQLIDDNCELIPFTFPSIPGFYAVSIEKKNGSEKIIDGDEDFKRPIPQRSNSGLIKGTYIVINDWAEKVTLDSCGECKKSDYDDYDDDDCDDCTIRTKKELFTCILSDLYHTYNIKIDKEEVLKWTWERVDEQHIKVKMTYQESVEEKYNQLLVNLPADDENFNIDTLKASIIKQYAAGIGTGYENSYQYKQYDNVCKELTIFKKPVKITCSSLGFMPYDNKVDQKEQFELMRDAFRNIENNLKVLSSIKYDFEGNKQPLTRLEVAATLFKEWEIEELRKF